MVRQALSNSLLAIGLIFAGGCGEDLSDVPPTVEVTGSVTFNGSPLPGADVMFSDGSQYNPFGKTDDTGRFTLQTRFNSEVTESGAPLREYHVTISKMIPPGGMTEDAYEAKKTALREKRESGQVITREDQVPPKIQMIPSRFSDVQKTKLKANVKLNQKNDFPFNVTK